MVTAQFSNLLLETKGDYQEVSVQTGVNDLVFPTAGGKTLDDYIITKVEVAETGQELEYIDNDRIHEYKNYPYNYPCVWTFKGGKIHLLPTPTQNLTNWLRIHFLLKATTLAELPSVLHPLVAIEMIISAKEKDEDVSRELLLKQQRFTDIAIHRLSIPQAQDTGSIEDYEGEDGTLD